MPFSNKNMVRIKDHASKKNEAASLYCHKKSPLSETSRYGHLDTVRILLQYKGT